MRKLWYYSSYNTTPRPPRDVVIFQNICTGTRYGVLPLKTENLPTTGVVSLPGMPKLDDLSLFCRKHLNSAI